MKNLLAALCMAFATLTAAHADISLYLNVVADVENTMTEERANMLDPTKEVPAPVAPSINILKYGLLISFNESTGADANVDSLTITSCTFSHERYVPGVGTTTFPANVSMAASKFNPPGDTSKPDIQAKNAAGVVVSTNNTNLVGTVLTNVHSLKITDHTVTLTGNQPHLTSVVGQSRAMRYHITGSYVVEGITTSFDITEAASVQVVPMATLSITATRPIGQADLVMTNGFSLSNGYVLEYSGDLMAWTPTAPVSITPGADTELLTVEYPPDSTKRVWRLKWTP